MSVLELSIAIAIGICLIPFVFIFGQILIIGIAALVIFTVAGITVCLQVLWDKISWK
jgi:hypothetical protein